jgi:phage gp45-like
VGDETTLEADVSVTVSCELVEVNSATAFEVDTEPVEVPKLNISVAASVVGCAGTDGELSCDG